MAFAGMQQTFRHKSIPRFLMEYLREQALRTMAWKEPVHPNYGPYLLRQNKTLRLQALPKGHPLFILCRFQRIIIE